MSAPGETQERRPRELVGRFVDELVTPAMLALRGRLGGLRDPLPRAGAAAVTPCEDCGNEHTTYAAYREALDGEPPAEARLCLGCIARLVATARPTNQPALAGTCEEIAK